MAARYPRRIAFNFEETALPDAWKPLSQFGDKSPEPFNVSAGRSEPSGAATIGVEHRVANPDALKLVPIPIATSTVDVILNEPDHILRRPLTAFAWGDRLPNTSGQRDWQEDGGK